MEILGDEEDEIYKKWLGIDEELGVENKTILKYKNYPDGEYDKDQFLMVR